MKLLLQTGLSPIYNKTEMDIIKYGLDPDLYPNIDWQDVILNPNSFQQTYYVEVLKVVAVLPVILQV